MGVGSYAAPGWFIAMMRQLREGKLGETDAAELIEDATRVVIRDQLDAGLDVISDGELARQRFVYEMYQHIQGLERVPPTRRLGITGYDMTPSFEAVSRLSTPAGFGLVGEFERTQALSDGQPIKVALPGPLTFLSSITPTRLSQTELIDDAVRLVSDELAAVSKAGAGFIQLDEPMLAHPPFDLSLQEGVEIINRCTEALGGYVSVHVCFGNNAGRPFADRRLSRLHDALSGLSCHQLSLELANREMAEIEVLAPLAAQFDIAAGVIDVKNFYVEPPARVAERIRECLVHVPAARLSITADCGFSALPRYVAKQKLIALVEGTREVRRELD